MYRLGIRNLLGWLGYFPKTPTQLFRWYVFGPWPVITYIIFGVAQGMLYAVYCSQKLQNTLGDSHTIAGATTDERMPLLA